MSQNANDVTGKSCLHVVTGIYTYSSTYLVRHARGAIELVHVYVPVYAYVCEVVPVLCCCVRWFVFSTSCGLNCQQVAV